VSRKSSANPEKELIHMQYVMLVCPAKQNIKRDSPKGRREILTGISINISFLSGVR